MTSSSSTLKQRISSAFAALGHPPLDPALLSQIAALSSSLHLGPDRLATAWEAHSLTRGVDVLDESTFAGYRNALGKEAGGGGVVTDKRANTVVISGTGLGKRKPAPGVTPSPAAKRVADGSAATPAGPGAQHKKQQQQRDGLSAVDGIATPSGEGGVGSPSGKHQQRREQLPGSASSSASVITPPKATVSATRTPKKYSERNNSGQLVASYNPHNLPTTLEVLSSKTEKERKVIASHRGCTIAPHPLANHPRSGEQFRHMFTPLEKRSRALDERLNFMSDVICEEYKIKSEDEEMFEMADGIVKTEQEEGTGGDGGMATLVPVGVPKQNKVLCVGRICNEAHQGRLNSASIRLEGNRERSQGSRIHLDLQGLKDPNCNVGSDAATDRSYSFFPGQIVAVEGVNSSGRTMRASRLLEGAASPEEKLRASQLLDYHHGSKAQDGNPLSIVSFCGPYTTKDNLDYDPLLDAISKVSEDEPDVVIMCGPFVDGRHPLVAGGEPMITDADGNERKASYESIFASKISSLLEEMYAADPGLRTQFVLVPSVDDAFLDAVYPQPPMEDKMPGIKLPKNRNFEGAFGDLGLRYVELAGREDTRDRPRRVHCVSNPCTLKINDVTIGVTSTDVLFHVSSNECNANLEPGTRLTRIAQHLIHQRSYYPLFPAAEGASLDLSRSKEWEMPVRPDVLIVPSRLGSFARPVAGTTVAINPGELTKNSTGGTYAVMDIHPMKKETLEESMKSGDEEMGKGVLDRLRVDIKRI